MSAAVAPRRGLPGGGAELADKRFRRAEVRPGRRRAVRVWRVARVVLAAGVLAIAVAAAAQRLSAADAWSVRALTVQGHHRLTLGEVEALVGGVRGQNLLGLDLEDVRRRLLESPWVADVTLRRVLLSTLDIRIVERVPLVVARLGQDLYLLDDTGVIIDDYGPAYADLDLPIVDGLGAPAGAGSPIDLGRAALTARFLHAVSGHPDLRRAVSQINVSTPGNVTVLLGDDPTLLYLGDEQFVERLRTYFDLMPTLAERSRVVDYVDLRFGNRVFLKDRK